MNKKKILIAVFISLFALLSATNLEPALAAEQLASTGTIEIVNSTKVTPFDNIEYLSYSADDLNYADWRWTDCDYLQPQRSCKITGLSPGKYIVRTRLHGRTAQVFTDVEVSAGHTTYLYPDLVWYHQAIRIFNHSSDDIYHVYTQEGNWVSEAVSLREEMYRGNQKLNRIEPGGWGEISVNREFPVHHILIKGANHSEWFYEVPANGVIFWYGNGGKAFQQALYLDFVSAMPGAVFAELYDGSFTELQLAPLSDGYWWALLPLEYHQDWYVAFLDSYCGGLDIGGAYCQIAWGNTVWTEPFSIDTCNPDYACNGWQGMPIPDEFFANP